MSDEWIAKIQPGDLRTRVTFQSRVDVSDAGGGHSTVWQDAYSCWAYVYKDSSSEIFSQDQMNVRTNTTMVIRYCALVKQNMNVQINDSGTVRLCRVKSTSDFDTRKIWMKVETQELEPIEATT